MGRVVWICNRVWGRLGMPVETIKDSGGKIISFIEWNLCDEKGTNTIGAKYCFIKELWIHDSVTRKGIIRYYINLIYSKAKTIKYAYWERHKYGKRIKMFTIEQLKIKEK